MMEDMELDMARSTEQAEYFKDTKIIDENKNPQVCFHGVNGDLFNEVDFNRLGTSQGSGYGPYLYVSRKTSEAIEYAKDKNEEHMIAVYVNITNPLYDTARGTISDAQLLNIIQKVDPEAKWGNSKAEDIRAKEKKKTNPHTQSWEEYKRRSNYHPPKRSWFLESSKKKAENAQARALYDYLFEKTPERGFTDSEKLKVFFIEMKKVNPKLSPETWNRAVMEVTGYDGFDKGDGTQMGVFLPEQIKAVNNYHPKRDNQIFGDAPIKSLAELKKEQAERIATRQRDREKEPERETYRERKPARPYNEYER